MLKEFKTFIMKGNIVDLAVAVIIGAAFGEVIKSFANDVLMQIVGMFFGKPSFNQLFITINGSQIRYGNFLTALINFVIIGFAMFITVKAINALNAKKAAEEEAKPTELDVLQEIRDQLAKQNQA